MVPTNIHAAAFHVLCSQSCSRTVRLWKPWIHYMVIEQVAVSVRGLFLHPFPPHDDGCSRPIWLKCLFRQNDEGFVTGKQLAVPLQRKRQKTAHLADVSHLEIRWSVVGQLFVTCCPVLHMKTRADDGNGRWSCIFLLLVAISSELVEVQVGHRQRRR